MSGVRIEHLIDCYHEALYRYAYRLTGSPQDAEDLTQQTFLAAQQKCGQLREPEKAQRWLYAILRNCFLKSRRRPMPVCESSLDMAMEDFAEPSPEADGQWFDSEQLQQAINELPDEAKILVLMFYFEDCSYKEIAAELEIPIGTVMSRLARAKQRLRTRLFDRAADGTAETRRAPGSVPSR